MLSKLFSYKAWDDINLLLFNYYDCELKQNFGELFPIGRIVNQISIDFEEGTMEFFDSSGPIAKFNLSLKAEKINVEQAVPSGNG